MLLAIFSTTMLFSFEGIVVNESSISTLFGSFLAGVLLTFTPCVLPMIPILSSIIVGQGADSSKSKSITLSVSYVLGTAVTYAMMGALAGATGEQLQSYFQNIWFLGSVSIVFIAMALSMFGLFTIQLPSFVQSMLNSKSQNIKGGSIIPVFFIGMITALILGACVSPVLISFLSVAISSGDALLGALTMFFMALGMGVPLILLGFGAGHLLPKAGGWMDNIKYIFGVLLLAVAIYIFNTLELFSPLLLWGVFMLGLSVYIGLVKSIEQTMNGWDKLFKSISLVLLVWGIFLLIGASYGERDILKPLPKLFSQYTSTTNVKVAKKKEFIFKTISSLDELEIIKNKAQEEDKLILMYFYTDTCPVCKKLKATTLIDSHVVRELEKSYITIKINMTDKSDLKSEEVKDYYSIFGPPSFVFLGKDGEDLEDDRIYGYHTPDEFHDIVELLAE